MQMTYRELKDEIAKIIPRNIEYEVDLEAGNIAIITTNMKPFTGQDGLIGKIARRIKRKIVLRTPIDSMMDMDDAKDVIQDIIPEDADITEMSSMPATARSPFNAASQERRLGDEGKTVTPSETRPAGPSRLNERRPCSQKPFMTSACTVRRTAMSEGNC